MSFPMCSYNVCYIIALAHSSCNFTAFLLANEWNDNCLHTASQHEHLESNSGKYFEPLEACLYIIPLIVNTFYQLTINLKPVALWSTKPIPKELND